MTKDRDNLSKARDTAVTIAGMSVSVLALLIVALIFGTCYGCHQCTVTSMEELGVLRKDRR